MSTFRLDITKEHCPMTFVKTKLQLAKMRPGDVLEVLLTEGEPLENLPKAVVEQGHRVVELTRVKDSVHKLTLIKNALNS
ncbi:MAG: sulfurtransferase TusA family protein [Elusimicrobia bacterium]|nr:sulfurtransferase TusA family protein [Elusimicrobiota bacterium]